MKSDVNATKNYYASLSVTSLCDCSYCVNYRSQVRSAYPTVAAYLDSLEIEIEKAFETSPLEPDENGMLEYCCCQYIVFGQCDAEYHHQIDDVEIRLATSYPATGIEQKHFVLELFPIRLRYAGQSAL